MSMSSPKETVYEFWNERACGEIYATGDSLIQRLAEQEKTRYELEPYIFDFARFAEASGRDVLEIGVGMGADHLQWAKAHPRRLAGIDLTERAVAFTRSRLEANGFRPEVEVGDAENLSFADSSFDLVYSWGVLHHSPNTPRAIDEVRRVLRPGGVARIMIYHTRSITGWMLWTRYSLLKGKILPISEIYSKYLESPGTKAYSVSGARAMCDKFRDVRITLKLGTADLLLGEAGQRHSGFLLSAARKLWPRWFLKRFLPNCGSVLMIEARK